MEKSEDIAVLMRENQNVSLKDKLAIVLRLSTPAILAQISEIAMQYIDAAMVGSLGAGASAAIGLVSSSTWLFGGIIGACAAGFSVQVAHSVGAGNVKSTKGIFRQSLLSAISFSLVLLVAGYIIGGYLPKMLGADPSIWKDATAYFRIFCLFIPIRQLNYLGLNMLQCSGNMKTPGIMATLMCTLDVIFNFLLIFPTRDLTLFSTIFRIYGAGMGVAGAQLGTSLAVLVCMILVLYKCIFKFEKLRIDRGEGSFIPQKKVLREAVRIGLPMALEQSALCLAMVVSTRLVAPLGTVAIAANSFAITAESICYMPGYGIGSASTTIVGQAFGAKRNDLAYSFAWLTTFTGMAIMTCTAILMYFLCPYVFAFLTPDLSVREAGIHVLRLELIAEPLYAASIVATGAMRGAGDTLIPGIMNLISIWGLRLTMAFFLTRTMGLSGYWIAMTVELCFRGIIFLLRLKSRKWMEKK